MSLINFITRHKDSHSPKILILWEWEYDDDFVFYLSAMARQKNLPVLSLRPFDFNIFFDLCKQVDFLPLLVIDRASDVHPQLITELVNLKAKGSFLINDPERMAWSKDKATMHLELVADGISVPYGIIVSRNDPPEQAFHFAAEKLGIPFVIKPSEGGGGEGVVLDAASVWDIKQALEKSRTGKVVLQKKITPKIINRRRAWFRAFYLLGYVIPCWWDDITHIYSTIYPDELHPNILDTIVKVSHQIAKTCQLAFFTSEFALDENDQLQVIDFVNEMCDMRMRSRHFDGVPDLVAFKIIRKIIDFSQYLLHAHINQHNS